MTLIYFVDALKEKEAVSGKAQGSLTTSLAGSTLQKKKNSMSLLWVCSESVAECAFHRIYDRAWIMYSCYVSNCSISYPPDILPGCVSSTHLSVLRLFATHNTTIYYMIIDLNQWAHFSMFFVPVKISVLAAKETFLTAELYNLRYL